MTWEQFVALVKHDMTNHPAVRLLGEALSVLERELAGYAAQAAQGARVTEAAPAPQPAPAPAPVSVPEPAPAPAVAPVQPSAVTPEQIAAAAARADASMPF